MKESALHGKVALITGAAGGIGSAIARAFAQAGAHLALLDSNEQGLSRLVDSLRDVPAPDVMVHQVACDLSMEQEVNAAFTDALLPFADHLDILVANVGVLIAGRFEDLSLDAWQRAFDLNFFTHVFACRAAIPRMKRDGGGTIIFMGSDQGLQPDAGLGPYAHAKAALHSLAKTLARELPQCGILVSAVAPGMTRTPLVEQLLDGYAREFGTDRTTAEHLELVRRGVPLERLGEPEEVASAVLFLATTPFANGTILQVSGGNVRGAAS